MREKVVSYVQSPWGTSKISLYSTDVWPLWMECWNQEETRSRKMRQPRKKKEASWKVKGKPGDLHVMSCKSKKKCFGNKGMSHIKCYEAVKQEPFELSKGREGQRSVGRREMETQ